MPKGLEHRVSAGDFIQIGPPGEIGILVDSGNARIRIIADRENYRVVIHKAQPRPTPPGRADIATAPSDALSRD